MARRRRARRLLFGAGGDLPLGHRGAKADATHNSVDVERKHGGHSFYYQFIPLAVHQHTPAAGCIASADVATPRAHRFGVVLWVLFDAVAVERRDNVVGQFDVRHALACRIRPTN